MSSLIRLGLVAGAVMLLLALATGAGGASEERVLTGAPGERADAQSLVLGSKDGAQPQTMEQFLTAVTTDVDAYWMKVFEDSGLPEPRVGYTWIPAGQSAVSACGDRGWRPGRQRCRLLPG